METYDEKIERVAMVLWIALIPGRTRAAWHGTATMVRERYRKATKAMLEEEARDI